MRFEPTDVHRAQRGSEEEAATVIVYLNGDLLPRDRARVSVFDRGFVFGDGVYEGLRAVPRRGGGGNTRIVGLRGHEERMAEGLREARIDWDVRRLGPESERLLAANSMLDAFVYWQVTRGTPGEGAPVRQRVPGTAMTPTVFAYCSPQPPLDSFAAPACKSAVAIRDIRWEMGRLKSISLMGNVWCAMHADAAGADDAILIRKRRGEGDGLVGEGLATNVVVVTREGEVCTPSLDSVPILAGVTRAILLRERPEIRERAVRASELRDAREIMLIGTTTMVASVTRLDGAQVGDGTPGPVAHSLLRTLVDAIRSRRDV
ncbi:MAG: aminotransferase class IV [Phycisphaeraceae bacterium]|nr:aminotransferase class IV [Phycisphaeraceae bacterium]